MRTSAPSQRTLADHPHYPISLSDLAQALDHSDEGFALTDPDGNYVYINEAHLRMYGYEKPQELLGRSWRTLYTPEWVRHFEQAVLPIMPRDLVWRGQVIGRRKNGSAFLAGVTLTLLPDGKITCNCRDESVRRESPDAPANARRPVAIADSAAADLHELGERLVSGLPGKFRRPLDLLTGYSSFFLSELQAGREVPQESLYAGLSEIDATGRRLAEQMRRLDLVAELAARSDSCTPQRSEPPNNNDWCQRLAEACRAKAALADRGDDCQVELEKAPLAIGYTELECVTLELLSNALQSSSRGDAVRVCGRSGQESYVLRVCDEGVGMPGRSLRTNERPFGQSEPCGFGLAMVKFILRRNGATIELDRTVAEMTCLKMTLPLGYRN